MDVIVARRGGRDSGIGSVARRLLTLHIERRFAMPFAIGIALVAGVVDFITTAEAVFTLVYVLPIAIAVWFDGRRAGYLLIVLCSTISVGVDLFAGPHRAPLAFVIWNSVAELGLYILFALLIEGMKGRLATEAELRKEALTQLRHADRLTTIGRLAAGLAHELGTPLNVVSGKASLVSSGRVAGEDAKKAARVIEQQADRMTTIIRHLLDFARRGGTGREATDLRALCEQTAELLRPLARRSNVTLSCEGPAVTASVNRSEMQQVLSNLVTNAIHAMPEGGDVSLIAAVDDGAYAIIRVEDEGDGIAPDVLPRIFDPFFTTKEVGAGTGLGLSVVHGIVDDHGGTIHVETAVGRGTTFILRLPR